MDNIKENKMKKELPCDCESIRENYLNIADSSLIVIDKEWNYDTFIPLFECTKCKRQYRVEYIVNKVYKTT